MNMTLRMARALTFGLTATLGCAGELDATIANLTDGGVDAGAADTALPVTCERATPILVGCLACHSVGAAPANGGFDMETAGWETRLVGKSTPADAPDTSACRGRNLPFLEEDTLPARGLFLDKLQLPSPPCGAQMPKALPKLNATDLACLQAWANGIVTAARR